MIIGTTSGDHTNYAAAFDNREPRVRELAQYYKMDVAALEELLDTALMDLEQVARPAAEVAEDEVKDMKDLIDAAVIVLPDWEDELHEARQRWEAARAVLASAEALVHDIEQVLFAKEQAWSDVDLDEVG